MAFIILYIINNSQVIQIQNLMCTYGASSVSKTLYTDSRNKSSYILLHVMAYIISDISEESSAFIITVNKSLLGLLDPAD